MDYDTKQLYKGLVLLCIGFIAPFFLPESLFGIYRTMTRAAANGDSGILFESAIRLVIMNCLRTTFCYLGAFMITEGLRLRREVRFPVMIVVRVVLSSLIMIALYRLISVTYSTMYDFGMPALITVCICSILKEYDLYPQSIAYKMVSMALLIAMLQCLTIIPNLTGLGFGRGEVAMDIKSFAELMGCTGVLGRLSLFVAAILFLCDVVIIRLANDERRIERSIIKEEENKKRLLDMRMENLSLRGFREIQHLVHDLKSPLTTIQGLSSLTELIEQNETIADYQRRITAAVDVMNEMISEILNEDSKRVITVDELCRVVLSQTATHQSLSQIMIYDNRCAGALIYANKIRLARAIINIIENAAYAVEIAHKDDIAQGRVVLTLDRQAGHISVTVTDNGTGMDEESIRGIWTLGFSQKNSSGLGLAFSRSVVENHGGIIEVESKEGVYTKATITLEEVTGNEKP